MNQQGPNGIEWLNTKRADGTTRYGYTWNVIGGCKHKCRWTMPDGTTAICYAELVANRVAQAHYLHGFAHHYWHPERLGEPLKVKEPAHIFPDSMADLFGAWVEDEQIRKVLGACEAAYWHTFIGLTKNAPRLLKFAEYMPGNFWAGVSSPPDQMFGRALKRTQQEKMLHRLLEVLSELQAISRVCIPWVSFEPLSWDVSEIVARYPNALRWAVIGAASNGPRTYQPEAEHVWRLLDVLDSQGVPVFFKGNLRGNMAATTWREAYPA